MKAGLHSKNLGMATVTNVVSVVLQRGIALMLKCIYAEHSHVSCCILVAVQDMSRDCDCNSESRSFMRNTEGPPKSGRSRMCAPGAPTSAVAKCA